MRPVAILIAIAAAIVLPAGCSTTSAPPVSVKPGHSKRVGACASDDCGIYSATLSWQIPFHGTTGYDVFLGDKKVAEVASSPYTATGIACGTTLTLGVEAHNSSGGASSEYSTDYTTPDCQSDSPFPLQVSTNGRFLKDASGDPWLMVGDSPWTAIGNADLSHWDSYLADRESNGFNTLVLAALCDTYLECTGMGAQNQDAFDGTAPFTSGSSISTYSLTDPNMTYWSELHAMVAAAQADDIAVELVPLDIGECNVGTPSWFPALVNNGDGTLSTTDGDYKYGQFLGTEFSDLDNVIWTSGNDFQCITTTAVNNDAKSLANGIHSTDPSALQTIETDFNASGNAGVGSTSLTSTSGARTGWASQININWAYTYAPTYDEVRTAYGQSSSLPVVMGESNYEGLKNADTVDGCGPGPADDDTSRNCRLQEWWTATSGAAGQVYGGPCYPFANSTTVSDCDSTGAAELKVLTVLLSSLDWQSLVPDTGNDVVTYGIGSCPTTGSIVSVTCVTTASDYDGTVGSATLALSYLPDPSAFASPVVDLADFAGPVTARWFDPTDGDFTSIPGSPFAASGTHTFRPTQDNDAGDKDWVLVLTTS